MNIEANSATVSLQTLLQDFKRLADANDWHPKHSPKNLAMAISVEASELVEIFQWLSENKSKQLNAAQLQHASHEIADVFLYLLCLADSLNIDLLRAAKAKMQVNWQRHLNRQAD